MDVNFIGVAAALAAFLGVWLGHVSVRKIERETVALWKPVVLVLTLSAGAILFSLLTQNRMLSTVLGITSFTLLWDALELAVRQPKRIWYGHAPANLKNPRHAKILQQSSRATTIDWLNRVPRGVPYTPEEMKFIQEGAE